MLRSWIRLEPRILKSYGVVTTGMLLLLVVYYFLSVPPEGLGKAIHQLEIQAFTLFLGMIIGLSSIFGLIYYQVNHKRIHRNTYAFVLVASVLITLTGTVVFDLYFW